MKTRYILKMRILEFGAHVAKNMRYKIREEHGSGPFFEISKIIKQHIEESKAEEESKDD